MTLAAGTHLGVYDVIALIGEGGMGQVYRAMDTRLKRQVALKILPPHLAGDLDRLGRFEREAEVLASLNHLHIAQIYGIEDVSGVKALVMELVEGEDLASCIAKGPLSEDEALAIARQVAQALEAAHDRGIIHRDLKPANIKVRQDGTVKVLDFGLAKALAPPDGDHDASHAATVASPAMTQAGVLLGTAAYMSPEQARGKAVDRRADIWAFGCVLYEMLTGRRLIQGDTTSDAIAAVLKDTPDLARVPPRLRKLVARCLQPDPRQRLRDIGDAWTLVDDSADSKGASHHAWPAIIVAGVALLMAAVGLGGWWRATRAAVTPSTMPMRLDVDLGAGVELGAFPGASVIISPKGDRLVFVSQGRLFTRSLDQAVAVELPGTGGAAAPVFSPNGEWVAFFAQDQLKKVSVRGGTPITLCAAWTNARGAAWGDDDQIVAALGSNDTGLSRVSANGGTPTPITSLDRNRQEVTHRWPQVLPGARAVLFTSHTAVNAFDEASIDVFVFADQTRRTLHRGGTYGRYVGTPGGGGYLLYVSKGTLFAERFDVDRLETSGPPIPAADRVAYAAGFGSAEFDVSHNGTLVYRSADHAGRGLVTLQYLDRSGTTQPFLATPGDYLYPSLSPDGTRVVLGSGGDLVVYDRRRDTTERLTSGGGFQYPLWTPDGRFVVFHSPGGISWTKADGGSMPRSLVESPVAKYPWAFTADGAHLSVQELNAAKGDYNVLTLAITRDSDGLHGGALEPFLTTPAREGHPAISPDGRWIAYFSDASGTRQVFVRAYPDKGSQWQISNAGGVYPTWSRAGKELLYRTDENRVMAVSYTVAADAFVAGKPRPWTEVQLANVGQWRNFDAAPDGRIVALLPVEQRDADHHVVFVENFLDQLQRGTGR